MHIHTEAELEELLSRPSQDDITAMASLEGGLLILGAGGKMGPSLVKRARRAADAGSPGKRIVAVARFTNPAIAEDLADAGVETLTSDLLAPGALAEIPDLPNVIFMAARKFGTSGSEHLTWAMNIYLPGLVAERFNASRIVAFSTGNVYPLRSALLGGSSETSTVAPAGEYAQSALGRERLFEYMSCRWQTKVALLRLNYAVDLRYGVLVDIARAVFAQEPIDLRMGLVNVIWQGDANSMCLRALAHCQSPPLVLNITGPETVSVREVAMEFGRRFGVQPLFHGEENPTALLSNAARAHQLFGYPKVTLGELIDWVAHWILAGGRLLNKPTHFAARDGRF